MSAELSTERVGVSLEAFAVGMYALGQNFQRPVTADTIKVFFDQLADRMTERDWVALVGRVIERHEAGGWAPVATLLRHLDEMRDSEAAEGVSEVELAAAEVAADLVAKGRA